MPPRLTFHVKVKTLETAGLALSQPSGCGHAKVRGTAAQQSLKFTLLAFLVMQSSVEMQSDSECEQFGRTPLFQWSPTMVLATFV